MRLHGDRQPAVHLQREDGSPALFTGSDNEVWSFGEKAYDILSKHMKLREMMRPYTRELMRQAHDKGTPVMRTMFYEFPDDEVCWTLKDQYMFGGDLLIAPVAYENMTSREVYLPGGSEWTSLWSGQVYKGGQRVWAEAPIDIIPVFLRDGKHTEWIEEMKG
jgi:alpha-D-xyloside xylohydrolase